MNPSESIVIAGHVDLKGVEPNELVRRVLAGCTDSSTELVQRFTPRLLILLERRLPGGRSDAEDIAQESLAKAFQSLDRFDSKYQFSTWLYTIAIRQATDFLRKEKKRPRWQSMETIESELPAKHDLSLCEKSEVLADVWSVARSILVESQYVVLWLKYGEGLSIQEIAEVLKKTQIGVRVQLHRARSRLSKEIHRTDRERLNHPRVEPLSS